MDLSLDLPADVDVDRVVDRYGLWLGRLLWLAAPAAAGPALGGLLGDRPQTPALIVEIVLWACWFAVLVATLTPSPWSLTLGRIAATVSIGGAVVLAIVDGLGGSTIGALLWAVLVTLVLCLPAVGDRMINGSAYGSERRMALRPPGFVMVGPAQLAWLGVFAGLTVPIGLLLDERFVLAGVAAALGGLLAWAGARILHQLSRRWIVFVPAGFVIRDPMQLVDAVLLPRSQITALGPALADDGEGSAERTDLSGGARGLALEVALREPTPITRRVRNEARHLEVANLVFTPTLPGAMLREARIRGLKIGTAG